MSAAEVEIAPDPAPVFGRSTTGTICVLSGVGVFIGPAPPEIVADALGSAIGVVVGDGVVADVAAGVGVAVAVGV